MYHVNHLKSLFRLTTKPREAKRGERETSLLGTRPAG